MRNRVFTILTALVIGTSLMVGCQTVPKRTEPAIQEKKVLTLGDPKTVIKGLEARSIDEILILPDDQIDLATAVLLISQKAHRDLYKSDIDIQEYRHKVDEMASALLNRMGNQKSPEGMIRAMNHYFFEELKLSFVSAEAEAGKPTFLTFVLDERKGDCYGLSILYLSIAERIGLSLFGVPAPGHSFVRYQDNVKRINIETTAKGQIVSDDFYRDKFNIPRGSQFYLTSLVKKEMIGVFLVNVASAYGLKGLYDQAITYYNKALEINPRDGVPYNNRGYVYHLKGQYDQAISDFNKALEINLNHAKAYCNRGNAYYSKGLYDQAISDYNKALEIDPRYTLAYTGRGNTYQKKGLYDQAISDYSKAIEINPGYGWPYFNMALACDKAGRISQAIEAYRAFIQYAPAGSPSHIEHARKRIRELEK